MTETAIIENVVYQHAENVCFLWMQRQYAVDAPHYSFTDLVHLDSRVEANIDGLRIAGTHSLPFVEEMIKAEDEGAYFAKVLLALERGDFNSFHELITEAESDSQVLIEMESALAWVDPKYLRNVVKTLLTSEQSAANILGLKTCASHGKDPGNYVETYLRSNNPEVRCVALRVGADMGIRGIVGLITNKYICETEKEKYEHARALAFLGERKAAYSLLSQLALSESYYNAEALNLFVQMGDSNASKALLKKIDSIDGRERDVVRGFGLLGDPVAIDWLIQKTEVPELCRLAGGSITMIIGVDLAEQGLETLHEPDGFEGGGINDKPYDNNVALDEDEDLPWPNPKLVSAWWHSSVNFQSGKQFLDGRQKTKSELQHILIKGKQRQRKSAAVNLALINPDSKYMDIRLPTGRQKF